MNKKYLPLYEKIGDLSKQLNVLYNKLESGSYKTEGVGINSKNKEELLTVIHFQWNRLYFLLNCIQKIDSELTDLQNNLKKQLCVKCRTWVDDKYYPHDQVLWADGPEPEYPCPQDFITYVNYCLVKLYDP